MEPILIGTNLQDINDSDTLEQILKKIVNNQKSLFEQILEIVKFYNSAYTNVDTNSDINTTVNVGSIKSVSLKYGIIYINYVGVNGTDEVIKFRLNNGLTSSESNGSSIYTLVLYKPNGNVRELPNSPKGSYAYLNGHIYRKDDTGWTLLDDTYDGCYFIYDNTLYKFTAGVGATSVINGVSSEELEQYVTVDDVADALSTFSDDLNNIYTKVYEIKGVREDSNIDDSLENGDYFIEDGKLFQYTGILPGTEVDTNMSKTLFIYKSGNLQGLYKWDNSLVPLIESRDNSASLQTITGRIANLTDRINTVESENTYLIPIVDYVYDLLTRPDGQNYNEGDLVLQYIPQNGDWALWEIRGADRREVEIFKSRELNDENIFFLYNGGLYQAGERDEPQLKQLIAGNESRGGNYVILTGHVFDYISDVEGTETLSDIEQENAYVETALCLEDNNIYVWDGEAFILDENNANLPDNSIFMSQSRGQIYKKENGQFNLAFDCSRGFAPRADDLRLMTSKAVYYALRSKVDKISGVLTGTPTAPTAEVGTATDQIATTAFVANAIAAAILGESSADLSSLLSDINDLYDTKIEILKVSYIVDNLSSIQSPSNGDKAILVSEGEDPILYVRGSSSWDEQSDDVNDHLIDSCVKIVCDNVLYTWNSTASEFVPLIDAGVDTALSSSSMRAIANKAVYDALALKASTSALALKAPIASPTFTGTPKSVTPATNDNSTNIATTAFVKAALAAAGVSSSAFDKKSQIVFAECFVDDPDNLVVDGIRAGIVIGANDVILYTLPAELDETDTIDDYTSEILNTTNLWMVSTDGVYYFDNTERDFIRVLDTTVSQAITTSTKAVSSAAVRSALALKAPITNPNFLGAPTAPTPNVDDIGDKIATTQFVKNFVDAYGGSIAFDVTNQQGDTPSTNETQTDDEDWNYQNEIKSFDVGTGNLGTIVVNKAPEQIRATDIDEEAFPLPSLYKNITNGKNSSDCCIWTAAEVGLQAGTTTAIKKANTNAIKAAMADPTCVGIKLDAVYNLYVVAQDGSGLPKGTEDSPRRLILTKDFIFDGEVGGEAVGGFRVDRELFYTEHSLVLNKVRLITIATQGYYVNWINCEYGIDVIKIVGCTVENESSSTSRGWFWLAFKNQAPHAGDWTPINSNYLNHLYVDGCQATGYNFLCCDIARFDKSVRFINNEFTDMRGPAICTFTENKKTYSNAMLYMSCPIYIVDNTFTGANNILRPSVSYMCAGVIESAFVYFVHNTVSRFVCSKLMYNKTVNGETKLVSYDTTPVYDIYMSGLQFYCCANTVTNIIALADTLNERGITKAKSLGLPTGVPVNNHIPAIRYYKGNTYTLNKSDILSIYNNRTYGSAHDYTPLQQYEAAIDIDTVLDFKFNGCVFGAFINPKMPVKQYVFSNNTINVPDGAIGGSGIAADTTVQQFICENNQFNSNRIASLTYQTPSESTNGTTNTEWLFTGYVMNHYSDVQPLIKIKNNVFTAIDAVIHLFLHKYQSNNEITLENPTVEFSGNSSASGTAVKVGKVNIRTGVVAYSHTT